MADTEADIPNGRISSNQLILSLQGDVRKLEQTLAGLMPQLNQVLEIGKHTAEQLIRVSERVETVDRGLLLLGTRVERVESRPLAMEPETRGTIMQTLKEHDDWVLKFRDDMHEFRNTIKTAHQFSRDEASEIRGYLQLARKHQIDDAFTPDEMETLHAVIISERRWQQRKQEREHEDDLVRVNLRSAKPAHILTAILAALSILGFLILYVFPHIRIH